MIRDLCTRIRIAPLFNLDVQDNPLAPEQAGCKIASASSAAVLQTLPQASLDSPPKKDARVLDVGCGDKPLAWDLRDAGYSGNITGFDFSPTVIEKLSAEARSCDRKKLDVGVEFMVLDARDLPFEAGSFDLVVDKGTVDAMLCDSSGKDNARAICREAARVAAPGGWFVIVSHIHPSTIEGVELMTETLLPALQDAASVSEGQDETEAFFWTVDVHCGDVDDGEGDSEVDSDADGGGNGGGAGRHLGDRRGDDGGSGATEEVGPSAYMARKVTRRRTRSSAAGSQRAIPIRIHEY
ncbi:unnamed protein product [Scytosiphon promiscuus]